MQGATRGAWVSRIDLAVDETVERHGERPGRRHRNRDPCELHETRQSPGSEDHPEVREWQGKDRVFELDCIEKDSHLVPAGRWWRHTDRSHRGTILRT